MRADRVCGEICMRNANGKDQRPAVNGKCTLDMGFTEPKDVALQDRKEQQPEIEKHRNQSTRPCIKAACSASVFEATGR